MTPAFPDKERLEFLFKLLKTALAALPPEAEPIRKIAQFREILISESDRGCALMAAAFIDDKLDLLLRKNLVNDSSVLADIFSHTGPLGTFSGKINLAYAMGLIPKSAMRELHILRKIRNDFAHTAAPIGFGERIISNRCRALELHGRKGAVGARSKFMSSMMGLLFCIEEGIFKAKQIEAAVEFDASRRESAINQLNDILVKLGREDLSDIIVELK